MEINPRRKRNFHMYEYIVNYDTDSFGFIADRSMYSTLLTTDTPSLSLQSETCKSDNTRDTLEDEYRAAVARLAPFLPIQLQLPPIQKEKGRQTRRRDWWATQKRRRRWRRHPTRKNVAYRRRRTFRGHK